MQRKQQSVKLTELYEHPNNPRKNLNVDELVESIKEVGQLSPLLVRQWGDGFQIISGHRRKAALIKVGLSQAECDVVEMNDEQAFKALMVANIQSHSLSEIEEAEGIRQMIEQFGWTQERVAKEFGKTRQWISLRLSLIQDLVREVQEMVATRVANTGQARHIARLPQEQQIIVAQKVVEQELSTRETEKLVKVLKDESIPADLKQKVIDSPHIKPEAVEAAALIQDKEVRQKVTEKLERDTITPTEIHKIAQETEIKQAAKEIREEIFAEHAAVGTKAPILTDEEIAKNKRYDDVKWFMQNISDVEHALMPMPKLIERLIEFNETDAVLNRFDKIFEFMKRIRQDIISARENKKTIERNSKVVELRNR